MFTNALMYFASVNYGEEGFIALAAKGYYFLQRELIMQFCKQKINFVLTHSAADELISFICRAFQYKIQLKMFSTALNKIVLLHTYIFYMFTCSSLSTYGVYTYCGCEYRVCKW